MDEQGLRKTKLNPDGSHYFEHTEYGTLKWRQWMRANLPTGKEGMSIEDLDAIVTIFGPLSPDIPKCMLVEFKLWGVQLDYSQLKTLRLLHDLLRRGDPKRVQYRGVYVIEWPRDDDEFVRINYEHLLKFEPQLREFFLFKLHVPSLFSGSRPSK